MKNEWAMNKLIKNDVQWMKLGLRDEWGSIDILFESEKVWNKMWII